LPKSLHLDFYKQLANKVAYPKNYAEVAIELRGGFFARLLAHAAISGVILNGAVTPPEGYTGWRMREFWEASTETKCGFYDLLQATDAEVTTKWPDGGNRRSEFGMWKKEAPGASVEEILGTFGNKSVIKIVPSNWIPENDSRILMAPLSCGVNIHSGNNININSSVIRRELRKLVPNEVIRETVGISLDRSAPLLLDSGSLISKKRHL